MVRAYRKTITRQRQRYIPKWQRGFVLDIAKDVRSEADCDVVGACDDLSKILHERLKEAGIQSSVIHGYWVGPLRKNYAEDAADWYVESERYPPHTWVSIPRGDGTIVDVTADQFSSRIPAVWFPANKKFYRRCNVHYLT